LSLGVTLLVLSAAVMHASWNALLKAGNDKVVMQSLVVIVPAVLVLPALFALPLPNTAAWPFLAFSTVLHGAYYVTLVNSYRHGDLSQVYPVARGSAPLLVALGAWIGAAEAMRPLEWAGVGAISLGIMSLAGLRRADRQEMKGVGFAAATGVAIALYSVADGMGVRRTAEPMSYILWLLFLEALPMVAIAAWFRRGRVVAAFRPHLGRGVIGGVILGLGYGIVIWAMDRAPMAQVSALRETSVVLAAVIGALFLDECFGRRRIAAAAVVAGGSALLQLAG
jgi:drug/metabolite transporter (DMT)-like permease